MVKVALLGYGYWGPNLARCLNENRSAELSYIIDLNEGSVSKNEDLRFMLYIKNSLSGIC